MSWHRAETARRDPSSWSEPGASSQNDGSRRATNVKRSHILCIGLLLYVVSFFLPALAGRVVTSDYAPGWACAFYSVTLSWGDLPFPRGGYFGDKVFEWVSLLISSWINLMFLAALAFTWKGKPSRVASVLRIIVVAMIPFCWVVFVYEESYPREGHFVWIAGMLLVLFSKELAARVSSSRAPAQGLALI